MEIRRVVSTEEGQRFAEEHGLRFFETSCLTPYNVTEVKFLKRNWLFQREREGNFSKGKFFNGNFLIFLLFFIFFLNEY